jgi:adenylosuccinate lyase
MASWRGAGGLQELAGKDPFISRHLQPKEIAACFNPQYYLRHLDKIFRRVFSGRGRAGTGGGKRGSTR